MPNAGPRILVVDGIQYMLDPGRLKILSIGKVYLRAGVHHRKATNQYMRLEDGQPSMTVGDALIRPATIIGLTANCEVNASWSLEIRKKGWPTALANITVAAAQVATSGVLDVDVNAGDVLQFRVNGTNIPFPRGMLELAWRLP